MRPWTVRNESRSHLHNRVGSVREAVFFFLQSEIQPSSVRPTAQQLRDALDLHRASEEKRADEDSDPKVSFFFLGALGEPVAAIHALN